MTSTKPDYPEYKFVPSSVTANGQTLAKQYKNKKGTVVTDVSLPQADYARKNKLQNLLNTYEDSINIFSPEFNAQIESIANARKNSAIKSFENLYEPSARNAREDYYSRLGTLDSTAYLDRYNALEKTKADAYADIANDYVANLNELRNMELNNRYNYLNYLQNGINALNNQSNGYINAVNALSSTYTNNYNNYLQSMYGAQSGNNDLFGSIGNSVDTAAKLMQTAGTIAMFV